MARPRPGDRGAMRRGSTRWLEQRGLQHVGDCVGRSCTVYENARWWDEAGCRELQDSNRSW
jgi:hypothetical protein